MKRLFACTVLLRNAAYDPDPAGVCFADEHAGMVLRLVNSAIALDSRPRATVRQSSARQRKRDSIEDVRALAIRFLVWLLDRRLHPEFRPFSALCVLLLATDAGLGRPSGEDLLDLCCWVRLEEAQSRQALAHRVHSERWLVGLSAWQDSSEHRAEWAESASRILEQKHREYTVEVQAALTGLAQELRRIP